MTVVLPSNYEITDDGKLRKKKGSKLHNVHQRMDGYTFDSGMEAVRYEILKDMQECGEISELQVHPSFEVVPAMKTSDGSTLKRIKYEADFSYKIDGRLVVEDVKGKVTELFRVKESLFRKLYPQIEFVVLFKNGERR